jgi:hypothetical protein
MVNVMYYIFAMIVVAATAMVVGAMYYGLGDLVNPQPYRILFPPSFLDLDRAGRPAPPGASIPTGGTSRPPSAPGAAGAGDDDDDSDYSEDDEE